MTRTQAAKLAVSAYVKAAIGMAGQSDLLFRRSVAVFQSLWNNGLRTAIGEAPYGALTVDGAYGTNTANALFWLLAASTGASAAQGAAWAASARSKSTLLSWSQRNTSVMGMGPEVSLYGQIATKQRDPGQTVATLVSFITSAILEYTTANSSGPIESATSSTTVGPSSNVQSKIPAISVVSSQTAAVNEIAAATDTRKLQDIYGTRPTTLADFTELNPIPVTGQRPRETSIPTAVYVAGGMLLAFGIGYGVLKYSRAR